MPNEQQSDVKYEVKKTTLKIGNLIINVRSHFHPEKDLPEIMFSIASTKLKEKSA